MIKRKLSRREHFIITWTGDNKQILILDAMKPAIESLIGVYDFEDVTERYFCEDDYTIIKCDGFEDFKEQVSEHVYNIIQESIDWNEIEQHPGQSYNIRCQEYFLKVS